MDKLREIEIRPAINGWSVTVTTESDPHDKKFVFNDIIDMEDLVRGFLNHDKARRAADEPAAQ